MPRLDGCGWPRVTSQDRALYNIMLNRNAPPLGLSLASFLTVGLLASTALADSSVYVTNNTAKPITLNISSTLPSQYWKKKATTIPPFSRREIFETNRDEGVKDGKTYVFTAEVVAKNPKTGAVQSQSPDNFELKLKLKGSTVGSHMWQSHRSQAGTQGSWHDDHTKYSTSMNVGGRAWNVNYWAYFTGGDDDVEYVLREDYPAPVGEGAQLTQEWKASHLNVLSYNAYLRPTSLFHNGQMQRAAMIPAQLSGYDVVVFQEAFDDDARAVLIAGMKKRGYNYASKILGSDEGAEQDGGVIIVSRHPIVAQAQHEFAACDGSDCLAEKGVVYVKVNKKVGGTNNYFHVFGTHLNNGHVSTQNSQLKAMKSFINGRGIPKSEPVILAGDMNIDMYDTARFNTMLSVLNAGYFTGGQLRGHKPTGKDVTHDGPVNDLGEGSQSYYDYVLYSKAHRAVMSSSFAEVRVPRAPMEWKQYEHEKAMWDLSDHYAVYGSLHFANNTLDDWDPGLGNGGPGAPLTPCGTDADCPSGLTCQKGESAQSPAAPSSPKSTGMKKTPSASPVMPTATPTAKPAAKPTAAATGGPTVRKRRVTAVRKNASTPIMVMSGVCKIPPPK